MHMRRMPQLDRQKADHRQDEPERETRTELTYSDAPPVAQRDLPQCEGANDQRRALRAGVAPGADDEWKEDRQDGGAVDLPLIAAKCRRGEHLVNEERAQPPRALLDHCPEADLIVRLVERFHAAQLLDVFSLLFLNGVDPLVDGHG